MSNCMRYILIFVLLGLNQMDFARAESTKPTQKLETNANFDDLLIQGKYQFSDEAITTVEEDKVLDSLLGVRKDFRDRLERSALKR